MGLSERRVALLRGVNVGKAKRISMSELRSVFEANGYSEVTTLLNSGNVLFSVKSCDDQNSDQISEEIEEAIFQKFATRSRTTVLSVSEIETIFLENPLVEIATDSTRLLVSVLSSVEDRVKLEPLLAQDWGNEALATGKQVAYLWCPSGVLESKLSEAVSKALGTRVTTRNWATFTKIKMAL